MSATSVITQTIPAPHLAVHVGDSLTHGYQQPCTPGEMYPSRLRTLLQASGANIRPYNQGISGNTTSNMRGRMANFIQHGVPEAAFIFGGTNDTDGAAGDVQTAVTNSASTFAVGPLTTLGTVASGASTTGCALNSGQVGNFTVGMTVLVNSQLTVIATVTSGTNTITWLPALSGAPSVSDTLYSGTGSKFSVGGWVVVGGQSRQVSAVTTSSIALSIPLSGTPTSGTAVSQDTSQNIQDIANYLIAAGTDRVMVIGCAYVNYTSGSGDYYSRTTVSSATTSAITVPSLGSGASALDADGYCVIGGEERLISSITGAGPYVLNLSTPLTSAPAAGAAVTKSYAAHAAVRVKQKAAVTALTAANPTKSIVYCDLHAHQLALIAAGTVAQGDDLAWYNFVGNYHFSSAGSLMCANAVLAKINATSGWLAALS